MTNPMKRLQLFHFPLLFFAVLFSLGMGGNSQEGIIVEIPEPDRDFKVYIVDQLDISYTATRFSIGGLTYLPASLGKADMGLDFAEISKVLFYRQDKEILARVFFKDGEEEDFFMEPDVTFYGQSKWGKFALEAKDIKEIHFQ